MLENDDPLQTNTYTWVQSNDQVTITFLVPEFAKSKDLDISFERQYLKAGLKGEEPVFQAKLFQPINHFESLWQLEKSSMSPFSSLTASPSLSIASSYAFMSSPNHSPNSSIILPAAADTGLSEMSDLLMAAATATTQHNSSSPSSEADDSNTIMSQPDSPTLIHTPPAIASTPPHLKKPKYRILTIHLEKEDDTIEWVVPVAGPYRTSEILDVTSSYLLGKWFEDRLGDLVKAHEYFLSAAERNHTPSMIETARLYKGVTEVNVIKRDIEKDAKKSFEWYKRAADCVEQDYVKSFSNGPSPAACHIVGNIYGSGSEQADTGIEKDYQSALYYYNRCMTITAPDIDIDFSLLETDDLPPKHNIRSHPPHTHGERYFCSSAFQTGLVYLYGSHPQGESTHSVSMVEADPDLAIRYWKEAAILGHAQACHNIGVVYANGLGVEQDFWLAGKWFGRAIKLDATEKLQVPEGVRVVDWDMTKEQYEAQKKADNTHAQGVSGSDSRNDKKRRKRKSSKRTGKKASATDRGTGGDVMGAIVTISSVLAVAGIAWYLYFKTTTKKTT